VDFKMMGEELSATPTAGGGGQSLDNIAEELLKVFEILSSTNILCM